MTRADHASGSDRIFEAVTRIDPDARADIVVNLQGDLPTLEPHLVAACAAPLQRAGHAISRRSPPRSSKRRSAPTPTW